MIHCPEPRFTRNQLIFIAETILVSALDRVDVGLPQSIRWEDRIAIADPPTDLSSFEHGAIECAGMALAVLYAQCTHDGIGIGDALFCANKFPEQCEGLVSGAWDGQGKWVREKEMRMGSSYNIPEFYGLLWPDAAQAAVDFVDSLFGEYLKENEPHGD